MTRCLRITVLGLILPLTLLLAACEDLGEGIVFEVGLLVRQLDATPADSLDTKDPLVRAGIDASGVPARIRKADDLLLEGVKRKEVALIDQAIAVRPADPRYRFYKAALQVGQGLPPERAIAETLGVIEYSQPGILNEDRDVIFYEGFLEALLSVGVSGDNVVQERVVRQYCATLGAFRKHYPDKANVLAPERCR